MAIPPYLLGPNPWASAMMAQAQQQQMAAVAHAQAAHAQAAHAQAAAQAQAAQIAAVHQIQQQQFHQQMQQAAAHQQSSQPSIPKHIDVIPEEKLQEKGQFFLITGLVKLIEVFVSILKFFLKCSPTFYGILIQNNYVPFPNILLIGLRKNMSTVCCMALLVKLFIYIMFELLFL